MSVSSILDIICRDKEYYQQSGGGVTISGGEAFVQYDGLTELLVHCKAEGLHTAIETSGQVSIDKIIKIIPLVDLFLFDIKHIDSRILKKETLGNLDIILGNLQYIASQNPEKVIIRVPVLPNFNYKPDIIKEIFRMALNLGIREVHLLPYHTLGRDKYMQMGLPYTFACDRMLTKEDLLPLKRMGEDMCLNVKIGG